MVVDDGNIDQPEFCVTQFDLGGPEHALDCVDDFHNLVLEMKMLLENILALFHHAWFSFLLQQNASKMFAERCNSIIGKMGG